MTVAAQATHTELNTELSKAGLQNSYIKIFKNNEILIFIKNAVSNIMINGARKVKAIATAAKATFDLNEYSVFRRGCVLKPLKQLHLT